MQYIHIRNLEKFHPGYKDRDLKWAKIYVSMVQGDPDCEMITNEIDWARLIKFILLELRAKKPIPLDTTYLIKKGFDLKKRKIELTLQALNGFIEIVCNESVTNSLQECNVDKSRLDKIRVDKTYVNFEKLTHTAWNSFCDKHPLLAKIKEITPERRKKLKLRYERESFRNFDNILKAIENQSFLINNPKCSMIIS